MNIAFDAKRLFNNVSGLGNYSRNTINLLSTHFSNNKYHLFSPFVDDRIAFSVPSNCQVHLPKSFWRIGAMSALWRSMGYGGELHRNRIDIFHGLSNEIPSGLSHSHIKKVVTIHDLIFMRFPELYNSIDRNIYIKKFRYAAENADLVVSVSEYTKQELIHFYNIPENKIRVVYQSCGEQFFQKLHHKTKDVIRKKYNLPKNYILSVGTIEKRKNLLSLLKGMVVGKVTLPLVVIGQETRYMEEVREFISKHKMEKQVLFFHQMPNADMPAIYQMADAFVYISIIEGFGIPVLEAMASETPVITTRGTTMEESGADAYAYVNPLDENEIADTLNRILLSSDVSKEMIAKGNNRVHAFSGEAVIKDLHAVYKELI